MDNYVSEEINFLKGIHIPDIQRLVYRKLYDSVINQLERTIEPWYPKNIEYCGCVVTFNYPAYIEYPDHYEIETDDNWSYDSNSYFHHGENTCENEYHCEKCRLCVICWAGQRYYRTKD